MTVQDGTSKLYPGVTLVTVFIATCSGWERLPLTKDSVGILGNSFYILPP